MFVFNRSFLSAKETKQNLLKTPTNSNTIQNLTFQKIAHSKLGQEHSPNQVIF